MSLEEAKTLALDILKQVMEETITEHNVEVAVIPVNNANQ
jgi:20S proteasome alpha/beta subunit